jgi:hypothetical protein
MEAYTDSPRLVPTTTHSSLPNRAKIRSVMICDEEDACIDIYFVYVTLGIILKELSNT